MCGFVTDAEHFRVSDQTFLLILFLGWVLEGAYKNSIIFSVHLGFQRAFKSLLRVHVVSNIVGCVGLRRVETWDILLYGGDLFCS